MSDGKRDDLRWSAFRYVAGEMPDDERALFELRLQSDDAACDAVEQAVEIGEAVRSVADGRRVTRRSAREDWSRSTAAWLAALAASILVLIYVGRSLFFAAPQGGDMVMPGIASPAESGNGVETVVSLAWADLQRREEFESDALTPSWTEPPEAAALDEMQSDMDDVQTPPQWLLTAVAGRRQDLKETP